MRLQYRTTYVCLRLHDVHNYYLLKFIRFTMNDRTKLFEEFHELHLSLQNYHTRNSCFNLLPVRLDVKRNFTIFQNTKCFNVAPAQLCVPLSDYVIKINYEKVVLESYGRRFIVWILFYIKLYL